MRRGIVIADTHLLSPEDEHPAYTLVKRFASDFKPDFVVHIGDALDLPYLGPYCEDDIMVQAQGCWEDDVSLLNRELDFWQKLTPEFYFIQGNHDERTERAAKSAPKFAASLAYERRFDFKGRGIKYYRLVDDPLKLGKLFLIHGWYWNKYHARKTVDEFSGNIVYGHVHKFQTQSRVLTARKDEIQAWSIGCLCDKQPEYVKGRPTGWQHGFAILYLGEKGQFNLYPANITKGSFMFEGGEYGI